MSTPPEPPETTILASAIVSCLSEPKNPERDAVSIPDDIESADAFLAWVKSANNS